MNDTKRWYQSRAVWAGILSVALVAYNEAAKQFSLPPVPDFVYGLLGALGVYGRATATRQIAPPAGDLPPSKLR